MNQSLWTVPNNYTMPIIVERQRTDILLPIGADPTIEVTVISGTLPPGTRLEGNLIKGVPFEVSIDVLYSVVFRAEQNDEFEDRTINFIVTGSDSPEWITNSGLLPVGNNNAFFILDNSIIDFQLIANDTDSISGQPLEYFISDNDGTLPPGIQLTTDGRLVGIVEPLLALDKIYENGGYDEQLYSSLPLDYGFTVSDDYQSLYYDLFDSAATTKIRNRRKLNRYYPFAVTVTDGDNFIKRDFRIYVVGDDFLSADNTVMQVSTGVFTADNTNIRTPLWITPRNLGFRRANNYTTIFLETLNSPDLTGFIFYTLENNNDDGSLSVLPPGMILDNKTGIITGRIPYQPAVTKNYKFTIRATRFADVAGVAEIYGTFYEDTLMGRSSFKVTKLDLTGLQDGIDDVAALINQEVIIENNTYKILSIDTRNNEYDVITLDKTLSPILSLVLLEDSVIGNNFIKVRRLSENDKNKIIRKTMKFSELESYTIIDAVNVNETETRIVFDKNIQRIITNNTNIGFALFRGSFFKELISTDRRDEINTPFKNKTFELNVIGEIDSNITWITDSHLGKIRAEFVSMLKVEAKSTLPDVAMTYTLVDGRLPNGLFLNYRGEIIGKVRQYENYLYNLTTFDETTATWDQEVTKFDGFYDLGLTRFDNSTTTWDSKNTSLDRTYKFTVRAEDRLKLVSIKREFTIDVLENDATLYTDIYVKPLLKTLQRDLYQSFISNSSVFDYNKIYRPGDENFGIQKDLKMLIYAGIEVKDINEYVAAVAKNHKKKRFYLSEFKKAVAKEPGSNKIIYEVIYISVKDPYQPILGKTRKKYTIETTEKIKVNSVQLEAKDNSTYNADFDPYTLRPISNTIKIDSNAVKVSDSKDQTRYISNIDNMRDNIKILGKREREYLPLWMRTPQENYNIFNYTTAIPVCYCLPGTADDILLNIKNYINTSNFSIQQIDFEIDRYIIERTDGNTAQQFVVFPNYRFNI
jgi:hypothetical protein